ncbi:antibiotic biosynthesis monooxygenase subfamily protein [Acanthamoeba castellanii str. Neff]|uniref:Antibiotic biosynthesis monooxygenase subfamily protein n=1 Tax=Acanthamoeba castellanii (strain ATCC 30010 / Neff) TaxID=1257118 RepID=L8H680_ACACF|nr:antibiotic biosynthesis monooxygenase subfamily protein [Acanthamoeba castellanii str. Neff]ELR21014.1 antibiotic biosynthesis monooxygenase subfamily protein [Acanthamoeba castellanii str. Neff]
MEQPASSKAARAVFVVSQLYVKADKTDALEDIVEELKIRDLSRQEEGCMFFNVLQDEDDPTIVCFTEGWRSEEAADNHLKSEHMKKLFELTEGFVEKVETKRSVQQSASSDDEEENDN